MKRPPDPPRPPEAPPDPPIEMIREDGCGSLILLVLAAGMLAFMLGLATGCTTSFSTEGGDTWDDTWEDADDDAEDAVEAESPDLTPDVVEVTEDTGDDGGGDPDAEEEDVDPCVYYPTWYRDQDMDGWGRDDLTVCFPTQPEGYVDRGGDCCDVRPEVHPGVREWADEPYTCPGESWDYDCDGTEEPRWVGASWDRCDPYCATDCGTIMNEVDCEASVWWEGGGTAPCGAEAGVGTPVCRWEPSSGHCSGTYMTEGQQCR